MPMHYCACFRYGHAVCHTHLRMYTPILRTAIHHTQYTTHHTVHTLQRTRRTPHTTHRPLPPTHTMNTNINLSVRRPSKHICVCSLRNRPHLISLATWYRHLRLASPHEQQKMHQTRALHDAAGLTVDPPANQPRPIRVEPSSSRRLHREPSTSESGPPCKCIRVMVCRNISIYLTAAILTNCFNRGCCWIFFE